MTNVNLRKRATGAPKADPTAMSTPPSASAVVQGLPLKPGAVSPTSYTPTERAALEKAGWTPGQAIPGNIREIAAAMRAEASTYKPPVDPNTPPTVLDIVDIESLPPAQREEAQRKVNEVLASFRQPKKQIIDDVTIGSQAIPGWRPPNDPMYRPMVPNVQSSNIDTTAVQMVDNSPVSIQETAPSFSEPMPVNETPAETPVETPVEPPPSAFEASGGMSLTHCPHCAWDLGMQDIVEPTYDEKMAFVHSILGQKPFVRDYNLLGGQLTVRFRTLTTKEVDLIFRQTYLELERQVIQTREDYWERANRYRFYLQTVRVASTTFQHDLPDGYDRETNPFADGVWEFDTPEDKRETGLPQIEDYLVTEVFRTESIQRMLNGVCSQFNRLVAKLEAMTDNSDFWKPIEAQS